MTREKILDILYDLESFMAKFDVVKFNSLQFFTTTDYDQLSIDFIGFNLFLTINQTDNYILGTASKETELIKFTYQDGSFTRWEKS